MAKSTQSPAESPPSSSAPAQSREIPRYDLDDLLEKISEDTLPDEVFDDGPKGVELI